jgi:hypothetical protein
VQVSGLIARGGQAFLIFMAAPRQQNLAVLGCTARTRMDETGIERHLELTQAGCW